MLILPKRNKEEGSVGRPVPTPFRWLSNMLLNVRQAGRKRLIIVALLLAGLLLALGLLIYNQTKREAPAPLLNVEQVDQANLEKLKKTAPSPTAPVPERVAHLDKLALAFAANDDYKSAALVFDQRISLQSNDLDYYDYIVLARYRHESSDNAGALLALDRAASLLPPDNPDRGYVKANKLAMIDALRKEYSQ